MKAKETNWNDYPSRMRGWQYGRHRVGSWAGPPPRGAVTLNAGAARARDFDRMDHFKNWGPHNGAPMARLDLHTGRVSMIGPMRRLP
jgi:hypothetical protein